MIPLSYDETICCYDEGKKIGWKDAVSAVWTMISCALTDGYPTVGFWSWNYMSSAEDRGWRQNATTTLRNPSKVRQEINEPWIRQLLSISLILCHAEQTGKTVLGHSFRGYTLNRRGLVHLQRMALTKDLNHGCV